MIGSTPKTPRLALVLGGARSGKSLYAERLVDALATARSATRVYIATAQAFDAEMTARIAEHQRRRDAEWRTVDAPRDAPTAVAREARPGVVVLVDCLTLWLSNEILCNDDVATDDLGAAFVAAAASAPDGAAIVAVSNEVGLGLVPETPLGRRFRDAQGRLNQQVAAAADHVAFIAAGLPMVLKGESLA